MARNANTGAIEIRSYDELDHFVGAFVRGKLGLLFVVGRPGLQKSHALRAAVGRRACWIDGNATAFGLYCELYRQQQKPLIVLDDTDGLFTDRAAVRLLKCLCQTEPIRRLSWHSDAASLRREGIPRSFETTSRVAIIANALPLANEHHCAVADRGHVVFFEPTALEIHLRVADWFWDQDVFNFVGAHLHLAERLSMRDYHLAWELRESGLDWRRWLLARWGLTGARLLVASLKADDSFCTQEERARAFVERGGGCRATYFNHARKLRASSRAPEILLGGVPPGRAKPDVNLLELLGRRFGNLGSD